MKRYLILLILLLTLPALAKAENPTMESARQALEELGYPISEEAVAMAQEQHRMMQEMYAQWDMLPSDSFGSRSDWAYQLLLCQGIGAYDYDAMVFTPSSDRIYVFDAEFFNIEGMYTEFLQGVQAIMPEVRITAVREDLAGMDEYLDGSRKVYFEFNNHSYVVTLRSDGDWFNMEMIDFLNRVLKTEGLPGRLHIVSDDWDQIVFLIYGTAEEAGALRSLIGTEAAPEKEFNLLEWLGSLFDR